MTDTCAHATIGMVIGALSLPWGDPEALLRHITEIVRPFDKMKQLDQPSDARDVSRASKEDA